MRNYKKLTKWLMFLICGLMYSSSISAQSQNSTMDFLRDTGKIYTVVGVIVILFLGIVFYLFRLDNKLTKLEKQINDE